MTENIIDTIAIKPAESREELDQIYRLNREVHGEPVENLARKLIEAHPDVKPEDFLIALDTDNNRVAATLCLIPWEITWFGVKLRALELGIVATDNQYRYRGLQRRLVEKFDETFIGDNYDLSMIQGIPGFYSSFGYHYAVPLENQIFLELRCIEETKDQGFTFRTATEKDMETISVMYTESAKKYHITSIHRSEHYRFMADHRFNNETDADLFMVDEGSKPAGYAKITHEGFTDGLFISEVSDMSYDGYLFLLASLKSLAVELEKPYLKISLPVSHPMARVAFSLGGYLHWHYEWQVRLNLLRFLTTAAPVLEERIARSMFRNYSGKLQVSLYREGVSLEFKDGKIKSIEPYREQQEECAMPAASFYRLVLGCEPLEDLMKKSREVMVEGANRLLLEILFPEADSYLYIHY